jgi:PAS domain S-box-containing protein
MGRSDSTANAEACIGLARLAGALSAAVGALVLLGWMIGERHLTSISLAFRPMAPHTAVSLALSGTALVLLATRRSQGRRRSVGRALAGASAVIGGVELYECLSARPILVDRLLSSPGPHLLTGFSAVIVAVALLSLDVRTRRRGRAPAQYLAVASTIVALVMIAGYIFQEPTLYDMTLPALPALGMALPSAIAFALLGLGLLCARPETGLMTVVISHDLGGALARRFLLAAVLAPIAGLAGLAGEMFHLWEQEVAEALLSVAAMVVGVCLIVTTARSLNRLDGMRREALEEVLEWKEFFDRAAWGAVLTSTDGRILRANAAYATMHGYEPGELEPLSVSRLLPDARAIDLPALLARLCRVGHLRVEIERQRKDGTQFPAVVDATAVTRADGTVSHCVAYVQDISEQKVAERAQARLVAIVESSDDAILSSDANGVLLTANPATERLFGYSSDELVGRSATVFLPPERQGEVAAHLERIRRGEHVIGFETVRIRKDGTRFPAALTLSPLRDRDGRIAMVSSIVRDISRQKEFERQREEWASLVAHDLRQPLSTIALHTQVLSKCVGRQDRPSTEQVTESTQKILTATGRLDRMVDDLTDASRIEANRLRIEVRPTDLDALLRDFIERTAPMTTGRPVRLSTRGSPRRVGVDAARIEQVLGNLLSNALKYGEPGSEVVLDVAWRKDEVEVAVTNHGHGIPPEEVGRLFSRFERTSDARASGAPGLGVGLYICRGLVEAHGGRIWVESAAHAATTFHFTLPAAAVLEPQPSASVS